MKILVQFVLVALFIPILDFVWLALIMKNFYLTELGPLARTEDGVFKPGLMAAAGVYVALALGIMVFVLPQAQGRFAHAFALGAILGFVIYGVYDLTNLSLIQGWSFRLSMVDITWGTLLCGTVAGIIAILPLPE